MNAFIKCSILLAMAAPAIFAAPKLRLSATTLGPITIAQGQNGGAQSIEAFNAGDGNLALTVSSNVTWLNPSVGAPRSICLDRSPCLPITVGLITNGLARGRYTGIVTVSDPNAVDAPQTITITVQTGSPVPDAMTIFVAPGTSNRATFTTGSSLTTATTNPPVGTLSISSTGGGSFAFQVSYQVTATAPAGAAEGDYGGTLRITGSTLVADNKTVPVTMRVTTRPIVQAVPDTLSVRVAQGAAKVTKWIQFGNAGAGAVALTGVTSSAPWLTAAVQGGLVVATLDPSGQAMGTLSGTLSVASNAANGPLTVPVQMEVTAVAGPRSFYRGVVDNALYAVGDPVAPGGLVLVRGEQFNAGATAQALTLPLGTTLGGATVFVDNQPVPVYYNAASHVVNDGGQITFQLPYTLTPGEHVLRVDRDGQRGNSISFQVQTTVPRLMRLGIDDYGIVVNGDGSFPIRPIAGIPTRAAKAGETVVFYALGLGQTTPPVIAGQAVVGLSTVPEYKVNFAPTSLPGSGSLVTPDFVGLTPGLVGLYQINVKIPENLSPGQAIPVLLVNGGVQSNRVTIAVE